MSFDKLSLDRAAQRYSLINEKYFMQNGTKVSDQKIPTSVTQILEPPGGKNSNYKRKYFAFNGFLNIQEDMPPPPF